MTFSRCLSYSISNTWQLGQWKWKWIKIHGPGIQDKLLIKWFKYCCILLHYWQICSENLEANTHTHTKLTSTQTAYSPSHFVVYEWHTCEMLLMAGSRLNHTVSFWQGFGGSFGESSCLYWEKATGFHHILYRHFLDRLWHVLALLSQRRVGLRI